MTLSPPEVWAKQLFNDSYENLITGQGTSNDSARNWQFTTNRKIPYTEKNAIYGNGGIAAEIIDCIPDDCTKEPINFNTDKFEILEDEFERLEVLELLNLADKFCRLQDESAIVWEINDGKSFDKPVDFNNIKGIRGGYVIAKPYLQHLNYQPYFKTEIYQIQKGSETIYYHRDRLTIFDGIDRGIDNRNLNSGSGESILTGELYDACLAYTATYDAFITLLKELSVGVFGLDQLNNLLASPGGVEVALKKLYLVKMSRSMVKDMVMDKNDTYERQMLNLTGLKDAAEAAEKRLAALANIPLTRLLGQSPQASLSGNAGDSQLRDYYDLIRVRQNKIYRPKIKKILKLMSYLVKEPIKFSFKSLYIPTPSQQAEIELKIAQKEEIYLKNGILSNEEVSEKVFKSGEYIQIEKDRSKLKPSTAPIPTEQSKNLKNNIEKKQ